MSLLESRLDLLPEEKDLYLYYFLLRYPGKTLVFVNSIDAIRRLVPIFSLLLTRVSGLHAEMQQKQRLKALDRFTLPLDPGQSTVMFASDVAARGLDIKGISHVVHYHVPRSADTYVHRSGRTARSTNCGVSLLLCSPSEHATLAKIQHVLKKQPSQICEFPVVKSILPALKKRILAAQSIDKLEHGKRKRTGVKDWFKKAAEECDIIYSDGENSDLETRNEQDALFKKKVDTAKLDLQALLAVDITAKNQSRGFIAGNVQAGNAALKSLEEQMRNGRAAIPGARDSSAVQDLASAIQKAKSLAEARIVSSGNAPATKSCKQIKIKNPASAKAK